MSPNVFQQKPAIQVIVVIYLLVISSLIQAVQGGAPRPNIILIMADDLGFSDLGCYGSEIATPNIDQLAASGLRFRQFYNNAKCGPSRASLLTGLYSQQTREGSDSRGNLNLAQTLKHAGYRTLMTGRGGGLAGPPLEYGFDRFYGLLDSCCNYFTPGLQREGEPEPGRKYLGEQRAWGRDDQVFQPFTPNEADFYATDAFTNSALEYLDQFGSSKDQPFFLYLPYSAPHFPIQARPEDIAKYRGRYQIGWDEVRKQRHQRQIELGIVEGHWKSSTRDPLVPAWNALSEEERDHWDLIMAVYAAMIDRMDQGIGQILAKINDLRIANNTLILFLSDNGACAEDYRGFETTGSDLPPGPMESYRTQDLAWANVSNTPFRKYKWWVHEGGIASPLIAYWPGTIQEGRFTSQVAHLIDLMPTCLDLAGIDYPTNSNGQTLKPLEGMSLLPVFRRAGSEVDRTLFWQFGQCRAIRQGHWKLVAGHPNARLGIDYFKQKGTTSPKWELYDMASDRVEQTDLSALYPEEVLQMKALFADWQNRVGAR